VIGEEKQIAIYDFDGTLTTESSFTKFLEFRKEKVGFGKILAHLPSAVFSKQASAKERLFGLYFKGMKEEGFRQLCEEFCAEKIPEMIRKEMLEMFLRDLETQELVIIASASIEAYLLPFAKKYSEKVLVIGTKIEKKNGIITGRFIGKNCSQLEKIKRIITEVDLSNAYIKVFTAGRNDKPLMFLGNEVHVLK